ncbi:MAG TPA: phosphoglycerate dehydrogenase [Candidatus Methylacidiphilales bacterium]|nr:phosphoglycerate dehydrogenase [Candidatus Methylacidiphilales bacterium]
MTAYKILAADGVSPKGIALLAENPSFEVSTSGGLKEDELIARIADLDALVVRSQTKVTAKALAAAKKLKVIGRAGVGVDNVNVEAATERGIVVMNTPGGNTISTAEHTFSLLLALARKIPQAHASMAAGKWDRKSFEGTELCGKTLGIVGMGRIGGEVARRAIAFGMTVVAFDPYLVPSRARSLQVEMADDLASLLTQADFITVHMPLTSETKNILNAETIAKCKPGVRLINCARGGLIEESALLAALQSGHVAGVALDVYEKEPPADDLPFRSLPNVVLTPHLGASTAEAQESVGVEIAQAISDYLRNGIINNAVNVPNVDLRALEVLRPYLGVGEKLGRFLAQVAPPGLEKLIVHYTGKVGEAETVPVTRSLLKGLLSHTSEGAINEVNAPRVAHNLGLSVTETKRAEGGDFTDLIAVEAWKGAERFEIAATIVGMRPRIVRINGHNLEASPAGVLLLVVNKDRPGMVGSIGTLLAKHKINIASMSLSRGEEGGHALSVYNLDELPAPEVIKEIEADPGILSVHVAKL